MREHDDIKSLISTIQKHMQVMQRLESYYSDYTEKNLKGKVGDHEDAVIISDTISKYYTCLETVFLRISKFFENDISAARWHRDLLDRMTLSISGVRPAVIGETNKRDLQELLRYRHFSRYYFDMDYDWDRLSLVQKKFTTAADLTKDDLNRFIDFLKNLIEE